MNRLRTRLIASHLVVVLVTLVVISLLLVLLLRAQPVAEAPILTRVTLAARGAGAVLRNNGNLLALLLNNRAEELAQFLDRVASQQNARLLLLDANRAILYDSLRTFAVGEVVDYRLNAQPPDPPPDSPAGGQDDPLITGRFWQDGQEWLFAGMQFSGQRANRRVEVSFVVAQPRPQNSWSQVLDTFGSSLLLPVLQAGVVGLIVAVIVVLLTNRGIVRALARLRGASEAVAAGDYGYRVHAEGPDEIRDVATAFNEMAAQVQATQQAQQDFLANVSHDLRTPLTSIQGFSQAIMDGTSQDPGHHARIIYQEAGRLNRMVSELLDLARISAGRFRLQQRGVNLGPIAQNVAEGLAFKARAAGIHFVIDIRDVPDMAGDGDRLAQVLTNLVDNALKFTPGGGTVRLEVGPSGGGVQVIVSDTGQGIAPEELPRVFERFYQVDKSRGPQRGTGLGLAITAEIVHAHGGHIRADSGGIGQGTTFTIWFPSLGMSTLVRRA